MTGAKSGSGSAATVEAADAKARIPWSWSAAAACAALIAYLCLTPAVSGDKDASEWTLVLATNGVAHPTGYPLYTLFGHWFCRALHAAGASWSYAANAWSALGGSLAVFLFLCLADRLVPSASGLERKARFVLAMVPSVLLALHPMFTLETTLAEVNAWHIAWVLGTCLLFVRCLRTLESASGAGPRRFGGLSAAWGFVGGVGLAHHAIAVFVFVPLSIVLLGFGWRKGILKWWMPSAAVACALIPLSSYAIIFHRASHPAQVQWPWLGTTFRDALDHILGTQYRFYLGHFDPTEVQRQFLVRLIAPFLVPALAALVVASLRAKRGVERIVLLSLLACTLAQLAYDLQFGAPDPVPYFLPCLALSLLAIVPLGSALVSAASRRTTHGILLGATLAVGGLAWSWIDTAIDRKRTYEAFEARIRAMWLSIPFERAIVFWRDDMHYRLLEYQILRNEKPGIGIYHPVALFIPKVRREFAARHGFDAFAGWTPPTDVAADDVRARYADSVPANVNRITELPVIEFHPEGSSVRLLKKEAAPEAPGK